MVQADNDASRERLRRIIERMDATALAEALPGGWTVSASLAHLAWWDRLALERWREFLDSGTRPTWIDDAVNDQMLAHWLSVPPHDAVREVLAAAEAVDGLIAGLSDAVVEEAKRSGWERGAERHRHRNEHLDEIERRATPIAVRLATEDDVPALRRLVNAAYRVLGDVGLNYTGVDQDETTTRKRMRRGEAYVLEQDGRMVGTVTVSRRDPADGSPYAYINQLAVDPSHQRQGLGARLMDLAEHRGREMGVSCVRLDTAIPAEHLLRWYSARGYVPVAEAQWPGKTYRSVILEKCL